MPSYERSYERSPVRTLLLALGSLERGTLLHVSATHLATLMKAQRSLCCGDKKPPILVYERGPAVQALVPSKILHLHLSLNREGRWGTTDDFTPSFLHSSLLSTALWNLVNSRHVHFLILPPHLFFCLPCLLRPFAVPCIIILARPDEWDGQEVRSLRVARLPAGSWHKLRHL